MIRAIIFYIAIAISCVVQASQVDNWEQQFEKAVVLQKNNQDQAALAQYKHIEKSSVISHSLYFNMANSYYKLKQYGYARAYYEKALKLKPTDEATAINLNLTLRKIMGQQFTYVDPADSPFHLLTAYQSLVILTILVFIISLLIIIYKIKSDNERLRRILLVVTILLALGALFPLTSYIIHQFDDKEAMIIHTADGKLNPLEQGTTKRTIKEGEKVIVLESVEGWLHISIKGDSCWVKAEDLMLL